MANAQKRTLDNTCLIMFACFSLSLLCVMCIFSCKKNKTIHLPNFLPFLWPNEKNKIQNGNKNGTIFTYPMAYHRVNKWLLNIRPMLH